MKGSGGEKRREKLERGGEGSAREEEGDRKEDVLVARGRG